MMQIWRLADEFENGQFDGRKMEVLMELMRWMEEVVVGVDL